MILSLLTKRNIFLNLFVIFFATFEAAKAQQSVEDYINSGKSKLNQEIKPWRAAIQDFYQAVRVAPQHELANYYLAEAYYKEGALDSAVYYFSRAIEANPRQSKNYQARGIVYFLLQDYQNAVKDYDKATLTAFYDERLYADRANAYRKLKNYAKAEQDIQTSFKNLPDNPYASFIKSLVKFEQGDTQYAIREINTAIAEARLHPEYQSDLSEMYYELGVMYASLNQTENAIESLSTAIKYQSNSFKAYTERAIQHLKLSNNYQAVYADADKAIKHNSRYMPAYVIRAIAQFHKQKKTEAERDIAKYNSFATNSQDYMFIAKYVSTYIADNEYLIKCSQWAEKALRKENNFENNLLYAQILSKLDKQIEAKKYLEDATKIAKNDKNKKNIDQAKILLDEIASKNLDKTPPIIEITSPIAMRGVILVNQIEKFSIIGNVQDESGIDKVTLNGNIAKYYEHTGQFEGDVLLKDKDKNIDGSYNITVKAYDLKGNISAKDFKVSLNKKEVAKNQTPKDEIDNFAGLKPLGKNYALLIATDTYQKWEDLANPVKDAMAIAKDLKEIYGFETEILANVSKDSIILKIREYARKTYQNNDQLLIFFAGHGYYDELLKQGYLVAKDSQDKDESLNSYISHNNIRSYINHIPCKHIFVMMDACFGGTFDPLIASRGKTELTGINKLEQLVRKMHYKTRRYITSGGKEYVPDGRAGSHSPFARKVLEALRSGGGSDKVLSLSEIEYFLTGLQPMPCKGEFGDNEPGSDFIFIAK